MDWMQVMAVVGKYAPFVFNEMAKHPAVTTWVQQCLSTMPAKELSQVIGDVQANAGTLSKL